MSAWRKCRVGGYMMWKTMAVLVARKDIRDPMKVGIATAFSIGTELAPSMAILRRGQRRPVILCVCVSSCTCL